MAGLINTGIWGFLTSAKLTGKKVLNVAGEEIDEWISTFVSGLSGWMIDKLGNAEFKSVFVRDKLVTNEFVYNRIRVTEDEEIISSSIKIASYIDNEDGTYTVFPDLREGDYNPLAEDDLLIGYYHAKGNTGTIYSIQKFTAIADPSKDDQSILLEPEIDSIPYQHMIVVRVGNITDEERQSFIRISSKTNCQYFYDAIDSWTAYDDPERIKLALGHADIGLIPAWAGNVVSGVKRWFGLIADGVIIRGTFILHNDKTIEDELNNRETQIRGDFEIREDGISGKWQEVIDYAKKASDSASVAVEYEKKIKELTGDFNANAEKLSADFSEKVTTEIKTATDAISKTKEEATSSLQLTAKDFTLAFAQLVENKTTEATSAILEVKKTAESSLQLTAKNLTTTFEEKVESQMLNAKGEITHITESSKSELTLTAKELTTKFEASVSDTEGSIKKEISSQVTQNAKLWKVEIMGADENGNPNTILSSINADESGIQIEGEKVKITGELLTNIIKASGLNINDNFIVNADGTVSACGDFKTGNSGARVWINRDFKNGPMIRLFSSGNTPVMEMRAFIFDDGTPDIRIKMLDTKNLNKWSEYGISTCELHEALSDGTSYETLIEAGRIRIFKNGIERWNIDKR